MKQFLRFSLLSVIFLSACTWGEGAVKKKALAEAEAQFREFVMKEADLAISNNWLKEGFVEYIDKQSEFEVKEVKSLGESEAVVTVTVMSIEPQQRKVMAEIAGRVDKDKVRNFNFANARQMIAQQTGGSLAKVSLPPYEIRLRKSGSEWQVVKQQQ
jgi:hypothetical protein